MVGENLGNERIAKAVSGRVTEEVHRLPLKLDYLLCFQITLNAIFPVHIILLIPYLL